MAWLNEFVWSGAILAHIAAICYVMGLVTRNQLALRLFLLLGTGFYISYYYLAPATPLWDAIGWSAVLGLANISVIARIVFEGMTFTMPDRDRALFRRMDNMGPGEFRRLMKIAVWHENCEMQPLTREGAVNGSLYFVLDGLVRIRKGDRSFSMTDGGFVGEVGYLLAIPASASSVVAAGSTYVEWPGDKLAALERRCPGIRVALRDLINADMAKKVAHSVGVGGVYGEVVRAGCGQQQAA